MGKSSVQFHIHFSKATQIAKLCQLLYLSDKYMSLNSIRNKTRIDGSATIIPLHNVWLSVCI